MKIEGQQVIINDISGKYPRRVESFHGLDENFQKLEHFTYDNNNSKTFKKLKEYGEKQGRAKNFRQWKC